jgi:hypothetical protein
MRIGLIPLDERPVNTRYPVMLAEIAGVEIVIPSAGLLSSYRTPAPASMLSDWVRWNAPNLDGLIVSVEMLGYGGLIASRTTDEPTAKIINRLQVLSEVRREGANGVKRPIIFGFNLITRIPGYNSDFEEPAYWGTHGLKIHQFSALLDRQSRGEDVSAELDTRKAEIPEQYREDFLMRRLRNHAVNLAVGSMVFDGTIDRLVLSSDDTSEFGLSSQEKRWITLWAERLMPQGEDWILMYPGADEVGCALVAQFLNLPLNKPPVEPRFHIHYAMPEDAEVIAPYEDGAVRVTVERQVRAVGGVIGDESSPYILAVNPPSRIRREFDPERAESERAHRTPLLTVFVEQIKRWVDAGKYVIVADVAYPNGSDPVLVDLLRERVDLTRLAAYGAWNTAGNTIGVALAQAVMATRIRTDQQRDAQERFLLHRFIEDWAYQHIVREEIRDWLEVSTAVRDVMPENIDTARERIESRLMEHLALLPGFAGKWRIVLDSIRLPWKRTFEVDFDLERL